MSHRRLLLTAVLSLFGLLLLTGSAFGATQTIQTPFSYYLPYGDNCTHEPGTLSGVLITTSSFNTDATGGLHWLARSRYANTSITTDAGATYRLTSVGGYSEQYVDVSAGFPYTITSEFNFNLVGAGGQYHGSGVFTYTVNGIGDVTVRFERATQDCPL
jgi:hypothetical protein